MRVYVHITHAIYDLSVVPEDDRVTGCTVTWECHQTIMALKIREKRRKDNGEKYSTTREPGMWWATF